MPGDRSRVGWRGIPMESGKRYRFAIQIRPPFFDRIEVVHIENVIMNELTILFPLLVSTHLIV